MGIGGLIASALGGAAEGYGKGAEMEMKKAAEIDLKKQISEMDSEMRLREDEVRRQRDVSGRVTEEKRLQTPEYLEGQAKAAAAKFDALVAAGVPAAEARAQVATGEAAAVAATKLAPVKAQVEKVEYNAGKELAGLKLKDATDAQIEKAKTLVANKEYMDALEQTDLVTHAHLIKIANIKGAYAADLFDSKADAKAAGYENTADLQRKVTSAENELARKLGVPKNKINEELGLLRKRDDPVSKAKLQTATVEIENLDVLTKKLREWKPKGAAAAPAAAAPASAAPAPTPGASAPVSAANPVDLSKFFRSN